MARDFGELAYALGRKARDLLGLTPIPAVKQRTQLLGRPGYGEQRPPSTHTPPPRRSRQ